MRLFTLMSSYIRTSNPLKLMCNHSECKRFRKLTYRTYDIMVDQTCYSCGGILKRAPLQQKKRLDKAKIEYDAIMKGEIHG